MTSPSSFEREGVWFGYLGLQDSLETFPTKRPELFQAFPWAVISCSDGGSGKWLTDKFRQINAVQGWNFPYQALTDGSVAVSGADYYRMATSQMFMGGYEEVWFYDTPPPSGVPEGLASVLTSDLILTDAHVQEAVAAWVRDSHCLLSVGDGVGIIFATPNKALADRLLAMVEPDGIITNA